MFLSSIRGSAGRTVSVVKNRIHINGNVLKQTFKSSSRAVSAARQAAADFDAMGDEADIHRVSRQSPVLG